MAVPTPDPDPNGWTSPFGELLELGAASPAPDLRAVEVPLNPTFGTPSQDTAFWEGKQQLPDDCAIKCQQFILEQFTGQPVSEANLVREAMVNGWYEPGHGTPSPDVGNLLELHGIAVTHYEHANQFHLAMELAQGHKVIVGVESDALWHSNPILEALRSMLSIQGVADHAVVVSGIDTSDPQHVLVRVSDPGTGEALASYPMEQFLNAWHGSDFFMVATQAPAPAHLAEMAHFDYSLGHIADVAGLPYDEFLGYEDHPRDFEIDVHRHVEVHQDPSAYASHHQPPLLADPHGDLVRHHEAVDLHHDSMADLHHHDPSLGHLEPDDPPLHDQWLDDMS